MSNIKCILNISLQNIRKWSEDYRIWTIAVLVIILCFDSVRIMNTIAAALGNSSSLWIYPFAYSQYHMKLLYSLPIILMFCNAPFIDSNKLMILTRTGGRRYLAGQMGYIIIASLAYYGFVFLCTIVISLPVAEFSADWGDAIYTLAFSDSAGQIALKEELFFLKVSGLVVQNYTPISACLITLLLSWLNGVMFGFILCLCNLLSGRKYIGSAVCGIIMAFCCFAENEGRGMEFLLKYSPLSWTTLDISGVGLNKEHPGLWYCIAVYLTAAVVMGILIMTFGRKRILKMEVV